MDLSQVSKPDDGEQLIRNVVAGHLEPHNHARGKRSPLLLDDNSLVQFQKNMHLGPVADCDLRKPAVPCSNG